MVKNMIKNFLIFLFIISMGTGGLGFAQPHILKETIPANIPTDVRLMIEELYSEDPIIRSESARKLGDMGEKAVSAIPFLIEMLDDMSPCPRPGVEYEFLPMVFMSVQYALEKIGEPAVEPLIDALLRNNFLNIRSAAAAVLGEIKDSRAIEPLIAVLKSQDSQVKEEIKVRAAAAYALGAIKDIRAVEPLIAVLTIGRNLEVKVAAACSLGAIKDSRAVEPLIAFLKTDLDGYSTAVIMALASMKDPRAIEPLSVLLNGNDANGAFEGLVQIKGPYLIMEDERIIKYISDMLKDDNPNNREVGMRCIYDAFTSLDVMESKGTGSDSLGIRTKFLELMLAAVADEDVHVRIKAIEVLGKINNVRAVELLIACFNDKNEHARDEAENSLKAILLSNVKDEYKNIPEGEKESFLLAVADKRLGKDQAKWRKWWEENRDKFK